MQLIRQTAIESEFLQNTWTTRTVADAEDGTVKIQDDLVGFLQLIVIALVCKFFGCIAKSLERKAWCAVMAPWSTEDLTMRIIDGKGGNA